MVMEMSVVVFLLAERMLTMLILTSNIARTIINLSQLLSLEEKAYTFGTYQDASTSIFFAAILQTIRATAIPKYSRHLSSRQPELLKLRVPSTMIKWDKLANIYAIYLAMTSFSQ
jgi:hypothetical protein